jgi:hypothetical protein
VAHGKTERASTALGWEWKSGENARFLENREWHTEVEAW